jgi:acyl-CoA synthetase (AMP-forming)/AMP-acid ligase II
LMLVILKPDQTVSADELIEFCHQRIARFKVPKQVQFTDTFPYTPYGKVEKAKLREKYSVG